MFYLLKGDYRDQGSGLRVWGLGFKALDLGLGCRAQCLGPGFRVLIEIPRNLGFRV